MRTRKTSCHFYETKEAVRFIIYDCCGRQNVHFISRKAIVTGNGRVETANFSDMLRFQKVRNLHL